MEPLARGFVEAEAKVLGRHCTWRGSWQRKSQGGHPGGETVNDDDPFQGENLEEGARKTNSNLQRLIDAIGGLLAVSGDLLGRLQQILSGSRPAAGGTNGPDELGTPHRRRIAATAEGRRDVLQRTLNVLFPSDGAQDLTAPAP